MKPKILAPASNWPMLTAAVQSGCDEIYFGIKDLNMRASAKNFELNELKKIVDFCHENNVKANLALNTIVFDEELEKIDKILDESKQANIDAIICWDLSVMQKCKEKNIPFHISTQASVANSKAVEFFKQQGASRIIFARECSLEQLRKITKTCQAICSPILALKGEVQEMQCISLYQKSLRIFEYYGSQNIGTFLELKNCIAIFCSENPRDFRELKISH